ncbi:MAG TPA: peptide ABC transporter substrate-binding protein [Anaerolineaceae bacterium]|nr:peptide ABC transporter substrate-binding protein [Anaerolineaceae bacterium]
MKKFWLFFFTAIMIVSMIAACAPQIPTPTATEVPVTATATEPPAPAEPVSFHYVFLDEPPGIDPGISQGATQSTIYAALYEGLVTVDDKGNIIPGAAEKWETSADGMEYTFHLREGLTWSDGKPLTANDFEYAWLRVLKPETASTYSWFVEMFIKNGTAFAKGEVPAEEVGVTATDDRTLVVKLNMPAAYFLQALLSGCWLPVRQDMVEANPEKWPFDSATAVSNGPFVLTEYKIGSYITAEKNPNYWDAASVKIDKIKFSFITDANTAYSAFAAGDVDGIAGVPTTELVNILASDDRLFPYDQLRISFLRLNTKSPGLDNALVRRAINLAFDRKGYLDGLGSITAKPILGSVPNGLILDGKNFRDVSGDNGLAAVAQIEEAKKLLAEAGYPDGNGLPVYRLHCADNMVKNAEIVQQMLLTNLGIKTEIKPVDTKLNFPMMVEGKYDIAFGGWGGDYTHPMTFLELFTSTAYDNATGWANAEYDELINKARLATNEAEALDLMVNAEHILMQESPIVPISVPSGAIMMQKYVTNWFISPSDTLYIARAVITK